MHGPQARYGSGALPEQLTVLKLWNLGSCVHPTKAHLRIMVALQIHHSPGSRPQPPPEAHGGPSARLTLSQSDPRTACRAQPLHLPPRSSTCRMQFHHTHTYTQSWPSLLPRPGQHAKAHMCANARSPSSLCAPVSREHSFDGPVWLSHPPFCTLAQS